jgi:hypothetical protein
MRHRRFVQAMVLQGLSLPMMIRFLGLASKSTRGEEQTEALRNHASGGYRPPGARKSAEWGK